MMPNKPEPVELNPATKQYFNTLPAFLKETLIQSGAQIENETQLRACADYLTKDQK